MEMQVLLVVCGLTGDFCLLVSITWKEVIFISLFLNVMTFNFSSSVPQALFLIYSLSWKTGKPRCQLL